MHNRTPFFNGWFHSSLICRFGKIVAIRPTCVISIHVKFLFHFIGISRAGRGAWNTGNCWTWSKSLIGSENTK